MQPSEKNILRSLFLTYGSMLDFQGGYSLIICLPVLYVGCLISHSCGQNFLPWFSAAKIWVAEHIIEIYHVSSTIHPYH